MKNKLSFPEKPYKVKGGVKAPHNKNTAHNESKFLPCPEKVIISMSQHIGSPCTPTVTVGDKVFVGQIIGDSNNLISSPIHSSISGTIKKINKIKDINNKTVDEIEIESDNLMTLDPNIKPPVVEDLNSLVKAVRESGLVGLGGAGFPAHIKLNIPENKTADTLIINCAECEPYITADHREAIENSWDVFSGVYIIADILKIDRVIIGVENNKPDVIDILTKIADNAKYDPENKVRILPLKASYPHGAEKTLIYACTKRKVPDGKLPIDVGCIVMNIASVAFISKYIKTGIPLISKRITVDGSAIHNPSNVIAPIGTSVKDIIDFCGGYKSEPGKIILGGPMMGTSILDDSLPIKKQTNAIIVFDKNDAILSEPTDCINCGRCIDACPMNLAPPIIGKALKLKNIELLNKLSIMSCMECGCCSFSCPANRHIVQLMKNAKNFYKSNSTGKEIK